VGEAPGGFRRRLLLERAAYELRDEDRSVTEIAVGAGYESLEGLGRAFVRAFGATPTAFRRSSRDFRLPAPNGIHFHPRGGLLVPATNPGGHRWT
jgi:AraC family transcriptional regulator